MLVIDFKQNIISSKVKELVGKYSHKREQIYAGLDISHCSLKLVLLKRKKGGRSWDIEFRSDKLTPGTINSDGMVENLGEFMGVLENLIDDEDIKHIAVSIPTKGTLVRSQDADGFTGAMWGHIRLPLIDKDELAVSAALKVEEMTNINVTDAIYDSVSLGEAVTGNTHQDQVFIALSPPGVSSEYLQILQEIGIKPTAFEVAPVALWRSLGAVADNLVGIDIGHSQTIAFQMKDGEPVLSRTSRITGETINEEIKSKLGLDNGREDEIEMIKRSRGTNIHTGDEDDVGIVIRGALQPLVTELKATLTSFRNISNEAPALVISGDSSQIFGLTSYLNAELGEGVLVWDMEKAVSALSAKGISYNIKDPDKRDILGSEYAIALGLALRFSDTKTPQINLLPSDYIEKIDFAPVRQRATGFITLATAFVVVLTVFSMVTVNSMQKKVAYAESLESQIQSIESEGAKIGIEISTLSQLNDRLESQYKNIDWSDFLHYISDYSADGLWVNYIVEGFGSGIGNDEVTFETIEGSVETVKTLPEYDGRELVILRVAARQVEDVGVFLQHLRNYPLIEYVDISGVEEIFLNATPIAVFEIYCVPEEDGLQDGGY